MRAVIVANSELPDSDVIAEVLRGATVVIAADGGADRAREAGVAVDFAAGDFDSISDAERQRLGPKRLVHLDDSNATDLEKAVAYAIDRGVREIDILGGGGGRWDHATANLSLLRTFRGQAVVRFQDPQFVVQLVDGELAFTCDRGAVVSLVAIGRCTGVTTRGLQWELDGAEMEFSPLGIHNVAATGMVHVSLASGDLVLFRGRWAEPHR